ncbi:MAG TPA: DM13 domain-containing protein [Chitinophagaceae bacterium]|nr:DM13 domain-containing protein [Chitinophagaceae bacterium]
MKKLLFIFLSACSMTIIACTKNGLAPEQTTNDTVDTTTSKQQLSGMFGDGPYGTVTGVVKIYTDSAGNYNLLLDSFTTSNGPDLHVYLSQEVQPIHFIDLGKLKSTNGTQVYAISGEPDFNVYQYALIHCQQYNHLFGSAALK